MQTTTTLALRDAFKDAILSLTPTPGPLSAIRWSYVPSPRQNGRAVLPAATRNFDLLWRDVGPGYLSKGGRGVDYNGTMAMCVSYSDLEPEQRDHLIVQDSVDLRRALRRLINIVPGLTDVTYAGTANERDGESNYLIEMLWTIRYHQHV